MIREWTARHSSARSLSTQTAELLLSAEALTYWLSSRLARGIGISLIGIRFEDPISPCCTERLIVDVRRAIRDYDVIYRPSMRSLIIGVPYLTSCPTTQIVDRLKRLLEKHIASFFSVDSDRTGSATALCNALEAAMSRTHNLSFLKADPIGPMKDPLLDCFFQPQIDTRIFKIVGVEALMRGRSSNARLVKAKEMMRNYLTTGRALQLEKKMLCTVATRTLFWRSSGVEVPRISVNLTLETLQDKAAWPTLETFAEAAIEGTVEIDFPEIAQLGGLKSALRFCRNIGVSIALDNCCYVHTGPMKHFADLMPREIKLHPSMIPQSDHDPRMDAVSALVELGHQVGFSVVANRVASSNDALRLSRMGVNTMQGYLFCRPLPVQEVLTLSHFPADRRAA